jgi:hypothetical protein
MSRSLAGILALLVTLAGCSHQGNDERIHPEDSVRTRTDTATSHIRDTVPDSTQNR